MSPETPRTESTPSPITLPPEIIASQEAQRAQAQAEADEAMAQAAAVAKSIVESQPGYDPNTVVQQAPAPEATPAAESEDRGRFGMGVIETSMPPNPHKVPGYPGTNQPQ